MAEKTGHPLQARRERRLTRHVQRERATSVALRFVFGVLHMGHDGAPHGLWSCGERRCDWCMRVADAAFHAEFERQRLLAEERASDARVALLEAFA